MDPRENIFKNSPFILHMSTLFVILFSVLIPTLILMLLLDLKVSFFWGIAFTLISSAALFYYGNLFLEFKLGPSFLDLSMGFSQELYLGWKQEFLTRKNQNTGTFDSTWIHYQKGRLDFMIIFAMVIKPRTVARRWLASQVCTFPDNAEFFYKQARFYIVGIGGPEDISAAYECANQAIALGDDRGYGLIGYIHSLSEHEFYDPIKSYQAYTCGAQAQDVFSVLGLAYCCEQGLGVSACHHTAKMLWQELVEEYGEVTGAIRLSLLYQYQQESSEEAYFWAVVAENAGGSSNAAKELCRRMERRLTEEQKAKVYPAAKQLGARIYLDNMNRIGLLQAMKKTASIQQIKIGMMGDR